MMPVKSYWSHWCARECFVVFGFEALEPETKAVALPVQDLHPVARLVEENKKSTGSNTATLASGRIMKGWLRKEIGSTASEII